MKSVFPVFELYGPHVIQCKLLSNLTLLSIVCDDNLSDF